MWAVTWKDPWGEKFTGMGDTVELAWADLCDLTGSPEPKACVWYHAKQVPVVVETEVRFSVPLGY